MYSLISFVNPHAAKEIVSTCIYLLQMIQSTTSVSISTIIPCGIAYAMLIKMLLKYSFIFLKHFSVYSIMHVRIIFYSYTTYTQWGQTAVFNASAEGDSEVVKLLVHAGADLELHTTEVHTLWEKFMLRIAHAMYEVVACDVTMTIIC